MTILRRAAAQSDEILREDPVDYHRLTRRRTAACP